MTRAQTVWLWILIVAAGVAAQWTMYAVGLEAGKRTGYRACLGEQDCDRPTVSRQFSPPPWYAR